VVHDVKWDLLICQNPQLHASKMCIHVVAVRRIRLPSSYATDDAKLRTASMFYSVLLSLGDVSTRRAFISVTDGQRKIAWRRKILSVS
jgi:hypothetical protein